MVVAVRLPGLGTVVDDLFGNAVLPWILGAMMLACGLMIIAFHQYWYSASAVAISLFGWFVALCGLALMGFPSAIESGTTETLSRPVLLLGARIFFLALTAVGLWLTYVGWASRRNEAPVDNISAAAR
ncbi:hypothetical protein [Mycobacterium sp. ITM-2016-00318]|uniref:hypothetical protein n=1 Tax=Mycobacterium sp. ITM-2016-00318 TaxID=2099693 RepID=UPI001E41FF2A|nr:hypothetical protein [Mycobacterium sp. ITM-2016-00318]WNG90961.1 hypothetical protein C6A82_015600 [Mycobacterium sp. ITM-2016-00318]